MAALILTVYAMIMAKSVILPLLFALFFSILLSPFCGWLEKHKIPRFLSSFAAILVGLIVLFGIGFLFYNQMSAFAADADMFAARLEELLESAEGFLSTWFSVEGDINLERVVTELFDWVQENTSSLTKGITGAASTITSFLLVPVYMYLMLLFRDVLKNFVLRAFGKGNQENTLKVQKIIMKVKTLVQKYITGMLMVISILAVLNSVMLMIIGVDHAIFFGVFAAMLNVIPFIGPIMGSILPITYSLITMDSLIYPLIILIGFYIIQLFEGNLFTPTIVGNQVSMNAFATLLLIFIGAQIWGLAGMILFIPLGAIIKVICDEVDSLNHFGYVLGRPEDDKSGEKSIFAKKVRELSKRTRKKKE
ncbi:MAG: AI-2E family transporter [Balneolaceae bacterium]